jgi:uncharacterized membrane protein SpoIIM required for sporulation
VKQADFQTQHQAQWALLDRWMNRRAKARDVERALDGDITDDAFPAAYRRLCQDLALAQARGYSASMVQYLHALVQRGHTILYRPPAARLRTVLKFVVVDFPLLFRKHWQAMAVASALFFLPLLAMIALVQARPDMIYTVFEPSQLADFERMYDPANESERLGRESGTDLEMFGHYIWNNISIGFRTFASGLIACVGSVVTLVMNGVIIGGVAGHLTQIGYGGPFWRFVVGHSGPELMAIVISGGAGLQLGMALLAPGRRSRARALRDAGIDGAKLALGVFLMLLLAAFIEAFWSSNAAMPDVIKFGSGIGLWLSILIWLLFSGRGALQHEPNAA